MQPAREVARGRHVLKGAGGRRPHRIGISHAQHDSVWSLRSPQLLDTPVYTRLKFAGAGAGPRSRPPQAPA